MKGLRILFIVTAVLVLGIAAATVLWPAGRDPGTEADSGTSRSGTEQAAGLASPQESVVRPESGSGLWAPVTVHFHERVPFMSRRGDVVTGLTADRLALVFGKAGVPYVWRETPPKRQLEILRNERGRHVLLGWFRLPEREAFARFSLPIYRDLPTIAVARAGVVDPAKPLEVADLLGDPEIRLLVRDGYSYGPFLDGLIRDQAKNKVVTTVENIAMLKMLHAGRADTFFVTEEELEVAIEASGIPQGNFVSLRFVDMPQRNSRHILYGPDIEQDLIDRVDEAITEYLVVSEPSGGGVP